VKVIIDKILLDHPALVANSNNELIMAVSGIDLHDMPENGPATNGDHGLGPQAGFFRDSCAAASGEDDNFHMGSKVRDWRLEVGGLRFEVGGLRLGSNSPVS
jgi:hypothetical protein